jgi:hypothetical protein
VHVWPSYSGGEVQPPFKVRVYAPATVASAQVSPNFVDIEWNGKPLEWLAGHIPFPLPTAVADPALS